MTTYVKNFVTGHGINFHKNTKNLETFEKASLLWGSIGSNLEVTEDSIIMLCGAKNNGKSSLLRYLTNLYNHPNCAPFAGNDDFRRGSDSDFGMIDDSANRAKSKSIKHAYFMDCDPGQAEMTTPGLISANIIRESEPILESPSYLNVNQHEYVIMSSVGGMNMSVNPRMYIENCRFVLNQLKEHRSEQSRKGPIFVNTMGHIRNVGLAMLMDLIKLCSPTNLIVLNVESDPMRTIYADLSPSNMSATRASFYYEANQSSLVKLNYTYDVHNLQFSFVDSTSVASKNRIASQLAYLASISEALYKPIMQLNTKWISFEKVFIYCVSSYPLKEGIVLELLHHSWVHLVKLRKSPNRVNQPVDESTSLAMKSTISSHDDNVNGIETTNHTICKIIDQVGENILLGCGIVADIDLIKKRLAIITPVDQKTLDERVDCLIKPLSIQVPREILQEGY